MPFAERAARNRISYVTPPVFNAHPLTVVATIVIVLSYPFISSVGAEPPAGKMGIRKRAALGLTRSTPRQKRQFLLATFCLFLANFWPIADISRHLLLARLTQQLLITLAVPPLYLLSLPRSTVAALSKPRYVDLVLATLSRPVPATMIFSASIVSAMTPALVGFENGGRLNLLAVHLVLIFSASLVWMSLLHILPGMRHLSTAGRLAFLFVLSLVPNTPALILIFARRPLYLGYQTTFFGINPVGDQELTGALAKIASLAVFWVIAVVVLVRTNRDEELGFDPDPLTWADVQRELDRSSKRYPNT